MSSPVSHLKQLPPHALLFVETECKEVVQKVCKAYRLSNELVLTGQLLQVSFRPENFKSSYLDLLQAALEIYEVDNTFSFYIFQKYKPLDYLEAGLSHPLNSMSHINDQIFMWKKTRIKHGLSSLAQEIFFKEGLIDKAENEICALDTQLAFEKMCELKKPKDKKIA